jgi:hypothetical protein
MITAGRMAELRRMRWEESDVRFETLKLYSSKTKKWRTIKALHCDPSQTYLNPASVVVTNAGTSEFMSYLCGKNVCRNMRIAVVGYTHWLDPAAALRFIQSFEETAECTGVLHAPSL